MGRRRLIAKLALQSRWKIRDLGEDQSGMYRLELRGPDKKTLLVEGRSRNAAYRRAEEIVRHRVTG